MVQLKLTDSKQLMLKWLCLDVKGPLKVIPISTLFFLKVTLILEPGSCKSGQCISCGL